MQIKFGDIIRDKQTRIENVVYRIYDNDEVISDTALGSNGFNGKNVANHYIKDDKNFIPTGKKDIALAIKMQCYYAIQEMERLVKLHNDGEISSERLDDLLLNNHLDFISSK